MNFVVQLQIYMIKQKLLPESINEMEASSNFISVSHS